jgi:hypothetical protein
MKAPEACNGRENYRKVYLFSDYGHPKTAVGNILQHARQEPDAAESGNVFLERDLIAGAPSNMIEDVSWQYLPGALFDFREIHGGLEFSLSHCLFQFQSIFPDAANRCNAVGTAIRKML